MHERLVVDMIVFSTQAERRLQEERDAHKLEAAALEKLTADRLAKVAMQHVAAARIQSCV